MSKSIKYVSIVKCPICKFKTEEQMREDVCTVLYDCEECKARLKPKPQSCCIYCSYGSVPCPDVQKRDLRQRGRTN